MSIFKNLFSKNNAKSSPSKSADPQEPQAEPLPELLKGMSLDIVTTEGTELLTGQVSEFSSGRLTLERLPGWLSFDTVAVGSKVFVRGYNRRMQSFNLSATVSESTRVLFRVRDLKVEEVPNQRASFRLPVNSKASLFRSDDERFSRPETCTLVDISTGGACVESEYVHPEDEVVFLRFKLDDYPTMTFKGQIIRGAEYKTDRYRYGILFAQLSKDELTSLTRTMYNIQTGNRQVWDRTQNGSWG